LELRAQWIEQRTEQIKNGCDTLFRELLSNRCDQLKRRVIKRGKEEPDSRFFNTSNSSAHADANTGRNSRHSNPNYNSGNSDRHSAGNNSITHSCPGNSLAISHRFFFTGGFGRTRGRAATERHKKS
jgi:hypothetical protein